MTTAWLGTTSSRLWLSQRFFQGPEQLIPSIRSSAHKDRFSTEMAEETYDLWCFCEHSDDTKVFKVSISPTKDVYVLKELIHQDLALVRYDPAELVLIKVHDLIKVDYIMIFMGHSNLIAMRTGASF